MVCGSVRGLSTLLAQVVCSRKSIATRARDEPEKILILFGDSNFYYCPRSFFARLLGRFWSRDSVADLVHAQLPGRTILFSLSSIDYRVSTLVTLETVLETLQSVNPSTTVSILVLTGQNDADHFSRRSTRNAHEIRAQYRELIQKKATELENHIGKFPQVKIYWVVPFDDPRATFAPLYNDLVCDLKEEIRSRTRILEFGPFTSFEDDQYHLNTDDRQLFASQLLEWFANSTAIGQRHLESQGPALP